MPSGPWDQRKAEERDDVLVYTTPALTDAVEVRGFLAATLFAATSATDTDWTVKLVDVHPDGYAQNIQDGILRARYRNAIGMTGTLVEPGRVVEYTIDMWPRATCSCPATGFGSRCRAATSRDSTAT